MDVADTLLKESIIVQKKAKSSQLRPTGIVHTRDQDPSVEDLR